jgi:hypothetical protein
VGYDPDYDEEVECSRECSSAADSPSTEVSEAVRLKAALAVLQSLGSTMELDRDIAVIKKWREDSNPINLI